MNDKGGTMKPELEALYEGAQAVGCPHISHQQRSPGSPVAAVRGLAEARLCGGVYGCRPTVDQIITACRPAKGCPFW